MKRAAASAILAGSASVNQQPPPKSKNWLEGGNSEFNLAPGMVPGAISFKQRETPMTKLDVGQHEVKLGGVRLAYRVLGQGPYLVAHSGGPGMDARVWDDFAGLDQDFTIIEVHPRGSGLSGVPEPESYFLTDYAADLRALLAYLEIEKPALMGWSHGGMVVQQYAFTYPEALSKLILYDTAAYFGEFLDDLEAAVKEFEDRPWFEESFEALQKEWAGEYETAEEMAALWAKEMKFYFKHFDEKAEAYNQRTGGYPIAIEPLKFFNEKEADSMDLRLRLKEVQVPTLVIVGRHDFITNVAMAKEMVAHLPQATLEIFEQSGHFAHVEEADKFRKTVRQFILDS